MSILLESLRQTSDNKGNEIPGVGDSHFDDEMLSDEWLLAKLRTWKLICALLALALLVTSIGWFMSATQTKSRSSEIQLPSVSEQSTKARELPAKPSQNQLPSKQPASQKEFGALEIKSSVEQQSKSQPVKQKYIPKKVEQPVRSSSTKNTGLANNSPSQSSTPAKSNSVVQTSKPIGSAATDSVIDYESLSSQQQSDMPELEISSYAVSSNSKKSFVVLNGAFYGQGETIAPNLVLVSIEKESIVVRYFDQLIRKKYGL